MTDWARAPKAARRRFVRERADDLAALMADLPDASEGGAA
ncbi:ParB-like nuclease domain protein [Rhodovulum sp. P5]|nr:ParB-like nuclease domain protein [Rhodovulum sp. P5]